MGEVFKAPPIFGYIRFFGLTVMNWFIKTRHRGNNEIRQIFEGIASDKETHSGK